MTLDDPGSETRVPLQVSQGCVVASIQVDLSEAVLQRLRSDLLELIERTGATGVILDVSGISIMDGRDFEQLRKTMAMAQLMGASSVVAGLQPGVVASLVDLGVETEDLVAALDLDDAFRIMETRRVDPNNAEVEEEDDHGLDAAPANHF